MTKENRTSLVLGMISVVAFCAALFMGAVSCGLDSTAEEQEILLSFPKLSSMTVGQTHPFVVELNLPASGTEIMTAQANSECVVLWPESQSFDKGERMKTFAITAKKPGKVVVRFSLGELLWKDLPIKVFEEPLP
jgi:hypothetical protein